ncbi:MAG: hypothetical protein HFH14_01585, partial [Lachnospiraceae bacterium]|nr:hypothetical protein [Lachnospiraceae bacterium]
TELGQYITSLDESGKSLAYFMIQQQIANNNALDTSDSIQNLKLLAEQCGVSGKAIHLLTSLEKNKKIVEKYTTGDGKYDPNAGIIVSNAQYDMEQTKKSLNKLLKKKGKNKTNVNTPKTPSSSGSPDSSGSSGSTDKTTQQFDWIETKLSRISRLADAAQKAISRMFSINGIKLQTLNAIRNITKELNANKKAAASYSKHMDRIDLPKNLKKLIKNGKIGGKKDIQNITADESVQKNIEQFKSLNDKVNQCNDSMLELVSTLRELSKSLANIPIEKRDKALEKLDKSSNLIRARIDNKNNASDKNKLIDSEINNMHENTDENQHAAEKTQKNLNRDAKSAKKAVKKDKSLKESERKKIQSLIHSKKPITDSLLEKVRESGNNKLLKKLYRYNYDLEANETAQYDFALAAEQNAKSEREAKIEQHQNNIDEYESSLDLLSSQKENAVTATEKNELVDRELEKTRQIHAENKAIANLEGNANEASRLDEELKTKEKQAVLEKAENIRNEHSNRLDAIDRNKSATDARISKKEALGLGQSKADYEEQIKHSKNRQAELQNEKAALETYLSALNLDESDPVYRQIMDYINNCDTGIAECVTEQINYNKAIRNMDLKNYESLISLLERGGNVYNRYKSLAELHGSKLPEDETYKQIANNDRIINANQEAQKNILDNIKTDLMSNYSDAFGFNLTEEQADQFIEHVKSAPEQLPDFMESLGIKDFNEEQFSGLFENMNKFYAKEDELFQKIEENERLVDELFDNRISSINDYLDALKKEKDVKDRTFAIEKAQYELNRAKNNLTKKVWDGAQWIYTADTDAVQSAQEAYDNTQYEELVNVLENLIETLEDTKKEVNLYDDYGNPINSSDKETVKKIVNDSLDRILTSAFSPAFNIPATELPDFTNSPGNNSMNIDKIEFILPNINDKSNASDLTESFVNQLLNLPTYSKQYDWNK